MDPSYNCNQKKLKQSNGGRKNKFVDNSTNYLNPTIKVAKWLQIVLLCGTTFILTSFLKTDKKRLMSKLKKYR